MNIFGAPTFSQYVFQGAILIVAVGLSTLAACWRKTEGATAMTEHGKYT